METTSSLTGTRVQWHGPDIGPFTTGDRRAAAGLRAYGDDEQRMVVSGQWGTVGELMRVDPHGFNYLVRWDNGAEMVSPVPSAGIPVDVPGQRGVRATPVTPYAETGTGLGEALRTRLRSWAGRNTS